MRNGFFILQLFSQQTALRNSCKTTPKFNGSKGKPILPVFLQGLFVPNRWHKPIRPGEALVNGSAEGPPAQVQVPIGGDEPTVTRPGGRGLVVPGLAPPQVLLLVKPTTQSGLILRNRRQKSSK